MDSQQIEGTRQEPWIPKRGSVVSNSPDPSSVNMSEASASSSSQSRSGLLPAKRTLSESSNVRQMGPSPVKRQYQASSMPGSDAVQLKELERLEKREAFLANQLLYQLQVLHKRCNEERHLIVEEQRRLAERLEHIDVNEKAEEQAVRENNDRQLERVRVELLQLRQKLSLEGSSGSSSSSSTLTIPMPSTSGGQLSLNNVSDIRRLGSLDRQRQTLLDQLYAAIGSFNTEGSHVVEVLPHNCAPGRESAGSSTLTERVLPTSQHTDIAESSEQAQSSLEEDSEITSSSDVLAPQDINSTEISSGNQETSSSQKGEPSDDLSTEDAAEEDESTSTYLKKNETLDTEATTEAERKKEKDKDLDLALLKLKNIGSLVEEELQCSICNELLVAAVTINCAHSFCKHCLGEWKKQRAECPMCRMPITAEHRSVTLDSLISTMVGQLSLELQQRHKEVVEERAAVEAAAALAAASASSLASTSSGRGDNGGGSSRTGRHHSHNYNNSNHWQPLPLPHHHHHHHHHHHNNFAHVGHYPPHAHSHTPHAHNHAPTTMPTPHMHTSIHPYPSPRTIILSHRWRSPPLVTVRPLLRGHPWP